MTLSRLVFMFAVATLACAGAENSAASTSSTSSPSTPSAISTPSVLPEVASSVVPTDVALSAQATVTTPPLCRCLFNDERQLTELVCAASKESESEEDIVLDEVLRWNCSYVSVKVSQHSLTFIEADAFASRPDIQFVYLYSDFIEQIDRKAFKELHELVEVDLSDNSLLSVDSRLFENNLLLTTVSLASNPLVELESNAPILESISITSLDLSFCKLSTLSEESFSMLPNLQRLDLSSNSIQQLPVAALQTMPELKSLNIGNNRWRCDCALKEVLEFSRTISSQDSAPFPIVRCFGPERTLHVWSETTANKYCPIPEDPEYDDSASQEYSDEVFNLDIDATQTDVTADEDVVDLTGFGDLPKDTEDLRQAMSALVVVAEIEMTTQDVDQEVNEVIYIIEGDDPSPTYPDIFPLAVVVFVLATLIVFVVGISVIACKTLYRRDLGRNGWSALNEEQGGDAVYVKVPLE